jgi:glycosyltransferase involved in cell wall biosynthesis
MHIAINGSGVALGGGITVLRRLLTSFVDVDEGRHSYSVVCSKNARERLGATDPRVTFIPSDRHGRSLPARLLAEQVVLPLETLARRVDVVLSPFNIGVLASPVPQLLMFQNVAPFTPRVVQGYGAAKRRRLRLLRIVGELSARRASTVVFVSEDQRRTILPWLSIPEARTSVVYTGWDRSFSPRAGLEAGPVLQRHGIQAPYLLSVSQFYRYKNLVELVQGFARALPGLPPTMSLVLVGSEPEPDYSAEVRRAIHKTGVGDRVRILGHVPDADLPPLYAAAAMFLFSSTCESFPNILLEAMGSGAPVLSSNRCSMPEIAGNGALYFDPFQPQQIADLVTALWANQDRLRALSERGTARATGFSWNRTAEQLLEGLEKLGARSRARRVSERTTIR